MLHIFEVQDKTCFPEAIGAFPCSNFVGKKCADHNNRLFCIGLGIVIWVDGTKLILLLFDKDLISL